MATSFTTLGILPAALGDGAAGTPRMALSPSSATAGSAYSGTISGNTGAVTATSTDGTTLTVVGSTVTGTFSAAGNITISLTDTLGTVNIPFTVSASGFSPSLDFSDDRNSQYL